MIATYEQLVATEDAVSFDAFFRPTRFDPLTGASGTVVFWPSS